MCNACGFLCCAYDGFEKCGCDGCPYPACWPDDDEYEDDDGYDYECGCATSARSFVCIPVDRALPSTQEKDV